MLYEIVRMLSKNFYGGKNMKKILALVLALCMVFALCACGNTPADGNKPAEESKAPEAAESSTPAAPEAPAYKVAMITDYGDITDQSFNQTTYEGCKEFCEANGVDFKYYKPAGDSTAERVAMVDAAVADGYNVVVMPGYAFGETITQVADLYPDVKFIALDVSQGDLGDYQIPENVTWTRLLSSTMSTATSSPAMQTSPLTWTPGMQTALRSSSLAAAASTTPLLRLLQRSAARSSALTLTRLL